MDSVEAAGSQLAGHTSALETAAVRSRRWTIAVTCAVFLFLALLQAAPMSRETSQLVTDVAQVLVCLVAAVACGGAAHRARGLERWFWALTTSFVSIWLIAQLFWTVDAQGLAPADVLAPSDFLFIASSAPLLLALVVRPDKPREGALGFMFDVGLVLVFALHAYLYFSLGYLIGGRRRYDEWVNALGNLDSLVVLIGFHWVLRVAGSGWRRTYSELAGVMVLLNGGSALSSYALMVGEYRPGLLDLPWILPFAWLALVGMFWRRDESTARHSPTADFGETRRGLVLAILVVVAVPAMHLVMELTTPTNPALSRARHLLTLSTALVLGALFLARQWALLHRTEGLHLARENTLRRLFDSNPLPQFLCLRQGLQVIEVNRAAELAYGYSRDEFLGMSFTQLHSPGDVGFLERSIEGAAEPGVDGRLTGDWEHRTKNGATRVMELTARALELGPEKTVLVVAADVTEHRDLEERMLHSQKMEALGRLAGGIAHDFNNLLTAILGYCSLLGPKVRESTSRSYVQEIERSGERAAALTKQLLAFSRKQVLVPQILDLADVIQDLDLMLRPVIGEDVELVIDISEDVHRVKADRGQIEQVILNLAVNARDAMPAGGTLEISLFNRRSETGPDSEQVVLAVSDSGTGMDESTRSRIFEPFFTTKAPGKGTGLGLATVYGIVTQSGGSVSTESRWGGGTRFLVSLPRCGEVPEPESSSEANIAPTGSATILLVEDEEVVRRMTARILEGQGYRVLTAFCGVEALAVADRHREIDLVVTDVVMPGMKGPELVEELLTQRPTLKVLYVSGYAADGLGLGGMLDGDTAFLPKPFTATALGRRVREVLDRPVPFQRLEPEKTVPAPSETVANSGRLSGQNEAVEGQ